MSPMLNTLPTPFVSMLKDGSAREYVLTCLYHPESILSYGSFYEFEQMHSDMQSGFSLVKINSALPVYPPTTATPSTPFTDYIILPFLEGPVVLLI